MMENEDVSVADNGPVPKNKANNQPLSKEQGLDILFGKSSASNNQPTNNVKSNVSNKALSKEQALDILFSPNIKKKDDTQKSSTPSSNVSSPIQSQSKEETNGNINELPGLPGVPTQQQPTINDLDSVEKKQFQANTTWASSPEQRDQAVNNIVKERANPAAKRLNAQTFIANDLINNKEVYANMPFPDKFTQQILQGEPIQGEDNITPERYYNDRKNQLNSQIDILKNQQAEIKKQQYRDANNPVIAKNNEAPIVATNEAYSEIQKKIDEITNYRNTFTKYTGILTAYQASKNIPLPKEQTPTAMKEYYRNIGLRVNSVDAPNVVAAKRNSILSGTETTRHPELVDLEDYRLEADGLNAKQFAIDADFSQGTINKEQYDAQSADVKTQKDKLFDLHPQAKKVAQMQAIGQKLQQQRIARNTALKASEFTSAAAAGLSMWENIVHYGYGDDEVAKMGKEIGATDDEIKYIVNHKDDIPGTSFIGNVYNKFIGHSAQDIVNPILSLMEKGRLRNDDEIEAQRYDRDTQFQLNPDQLPDQPETIVDTNKKVIDKDQNSPTYGKSVANDNYLKDVANPEAGNHNWGYGTINRLGDALGTLGELWLATELGGEFSEATLGNIIGGATKTVNAVGEGYKELNALTSAQRSLLGNYAAAYAGGYNDYKKLAKSYLPEDEYSQEMAAHTMSLAQGLTFGLLGGPQKLISQALGQEDKAAIISFADMIPKNGIEGLSKSSWTKFLKDNIASKIVTKGLAENTKATALMTANQLADIGVQAMYNPKSLDQLNAGHEVLNEAVKNFITFAPISFFGAAVSNLNGAHTDQTGLEKEAIYRMGNDPIQYQDYVNQQVKDGKILQSDANKRIQLVNSMSNVLKDGNVPDFLSRTEKIDYANNLLHQQKLNAEIEPLMEGNPLIKVKKAQLLDLQKQAQTILENSTGQDKTSNGTLIIKPKEEDSKNETSRGTSVEQLSPEETSVIEALKKMDKTGFMAKTFKEGANDPAQQKEIISHLVDQSSDMGSFKDNFGDEVASAVEALGQKSTYKSVDELKEQLKGKTTYKEPPQDVSVYLTKEENQVVQPILKRINDADYINEKELDNASNSLYNLLGKIEKAPETVYSKEEKASINNLVEPLITKIEDYDFRTKTESSTTTEKVPVETPRKTFRERKPVSKSLEQFEGNRATITDNTGKSTNGLLKSEEGTYVLYNENGDKVASLGEKALTDRDITLPSKEEVPIPVQVDENGDVKAITLQLNKVDKENGGLVSDKQITIQFKDPAQGLDYAIRLRAEEIGEVPETDFETAYKEIQTEISKEVPIQSNKKQANESNAINEESSQGRDGETSGNEGGSKKSDASSPSKKQDADGENGKTKDATQQDGDVLKEKEGAEKKTVPSNSAKEVNKQETIDDKKKSVSDSSSTTETTPAEGAPDEAASSVLNSSPSGTAISKTAIADKYGKKFEFPEMADQVVANDAYLELKNRAKENDISEEKEAANHVNNLQKTAKGIDFKTSKYDIITTALHLDNLDKQLAAAGKIKNNEANVDALLIERDKTLELLRQLGNKEGGSLRLFGLVFNRAADGSVEATRLEVKRLLGVNDVPKTLKELKASDLSPTDKEKVRPYVQAIEDLNKKLKEVNERTENNITDIKDKQVQDYIKAEVTRQLAENKPATPKERQRKSTQLKDLASRLRASDELDKFIKGSEGDITKMGLDLGSYKEVIANLLDGLAKAVEAGENINDYLKEAVGKIKDIDKDTVLRDVKHFIQKASLPDKDEVINKIKDIAKEKKSDRITPEMVKKGLINDVVNDYIHTDTPYEKVISEATKELKEYLPEVDEKQVQDAILKMGEFKPQTKKELQTEADLKKGAIKRLNKTLSDLRSLESAEDIHTIQNDRELTSKEKKAAIEKRKSEFEKDLDKRLQSLQKERQYAKNDKEKSASIEDEINRVKNERVLLNDAIKNPKRANEKIKSAQNELAKAYREAGIRPESGNKNEIRIAQEADAAIEEIKNSDLDAEVKKEHIEAIEKQRDADLDKTKQGVLTNLRDRLNDYAKELSDRQDVAEKNGDTGKVDAIKELKKDISDLSNRLKPNRENLKDQIDKADQDLNAIIEGNKGTEFSKDLKGLSEDYQANWQKTSNELQRQQLLDKTIADRKEIERKLAAGQYTEIPTTTYDAKIDTELANQQAETKKAWQQLNSLKQKAQKETGNTVDKLLNIRRQYLIATFGAIEKVAGSAVTKPIFDPLLKQTWGRLSGLITGVKPTELGKLGNTYRQLKNEQAASNFMRKRNDAYVDSIVNYEKTKRETGENSKETQRAFRKLQGAEIEHNASLAYLFINAGSHIDIAQVMINSATSFDAANGKYLQSSAAERKALNEASSSFKKGLSEAGYWLESVNRTHGAMKSISARQGLLDGYIENLQYLQSKEGTITNESRLKAWDMATLAEYEQGRFGERTHLSEMIGKLRGSKYALVRAPANFLLPVAKISINIGKGGIDRALPIELAVRTLGTDAFKGIKLNEADGIEFSNFASKYYSGIKRGFDSLPLEQKKYINTLLQRGLAGVTQYALVGYLLANGNIKYGGAYNDNDPFHKIYGRVKGSDGKDLENGEWEFFGHRAPKLLNIVLNHSPYSLPSSLAADYYEQLKRKDKKGENVYKAITSSVNEIVQRMPFAGAIDLTQAVIGANKYKLEKLAASLIPGLHNVAELTDMDDKTGEARKVKIGGKNSWETTLNMAKKDIPGLRNTLPTKK